MTLRSESPDIAKAGISLLETLVVLSIISLIMAVSATNIRGPSPSLQVQRDSAQIRRKSAEVRQQAIHQNKIAVLDVPTQSCNPEISEIRFFPDGSADGPDLCIVVNDTKVHLKLNALTGRFKEVSDF